MAHKYTRTPYITVFQEQQGFKDTYGGEAGFVVLEGQLIVPDDRPSKTVIVFSHPVGGGMFLPICGALAEAGHHVAYCNTRFRGNDTAVTMEKCVLDLGAAINDLKTRFGYEKVILGGWSGGGSLSLYYQDQAENPTVTSTPAGDTPDLTKAVLPKADGLMMIAAHVSRAVTLTEWMDASILDESKPEEKDPELDLNNPDNPNQPPYSPEFLERYHEAQIARNRRITKWAKDKLASLKAQGLENEEFAFVVHGTMSAPVWKDPSVDPNDRKAPDWCYLGDPKTVNNGPVGLARFCTLRSWLSQWSYDETNADGTGNASRISIPVLAIQNSADDACTPSHARRLFEAVSHDDKEYYEVKGATHYYAMQPDKVTEAVGVISNWLDKKGFDSVG